MHAMPDLPHNGASDSHVLLAGRVAALEALYREVMATRMQGVPVLNPAVQVQALGFEPAVRAQDAQGAKDAQDTELDESAIGILITPWFMSLVLLPLHRLEQPAQVGCSQAHYVGTTCLDFISSHDAQLGSYAACSLFSPMFEFTDHAAALATAQAVLDKLREAPPPVPRASAPAQASTLEAPARRNFLLARGHAQARGQHG